MHPFVKFTSTTSSSDDVTSSDSGSWRIVSIEIDNVCVDYGKVYEDFVGPLFIDDCEIPTTKYIEPIFPPEKMKVSKQILNNSASKPTLHASSSNTATATTSKRPTSTTDQATGSKKQKTTSGPAEKKQKSILSFLKK